MLKRIPSHRTRLRAAVGLSTAVFTVLSLAACGSGQGASSPTGELLSGVRERGVLRVANTQANPPWNFVDGSKGLAGFDVDVARQVAKRIGVDKVEFVPGEFETFIAGVKSNRYDIVISGQTITEERKQEVAFSRPSQVNGVGIIVAKDNTTISGADDLRDATIAVSAGTTNEEQARKQFPDAQIKTYTNATLGLKDVAAGRADAMIVSAFQGTFLAEKNSLPVKRVGDLIDTEVNAMSFKKGEPKFKAAVDEALNAMIEDGTLTRISKKWLGGLDMATELADLPASTS